MRIVLFAWLFLLPFQIYSQDGIKELLNQRQELYNEINAAKSTSAQFLPKVESTSDSKDELARQIIEMDNQIIERLRLDQELNDLAGADLSRARTSSPEEEDDIQKLKTALAQKSYEAHTEEMERWKYEMASLIFFIGTLTFGWLFVKEKVNFNSLKQPNWIPIQAKE